MSDNKPVRASSINNATIQARYSGNQSRLRGIQEELEVDEFVVDEINVRMQSYWRRSREVLVEDDSMNGEQQDDLKDILYYNDCVCFILILTFSS